MHAAAGGDALIAPNITRRLLSTLAAREPSKRRTQPIESLTEREEEVLALVACGRTHAEIAADLFIGLTTAKIHVASRLTRIGARNRVEIAMGAHDAAGWGTEAAVQELGDAVPPSKQNSMNAVSPRRCGASRASRLR